MASQVLSQDPWATAWAPPEQVSEWYGQIKVNPWFCSLVKGIGRVPYDPTQLDPNTGNAPRRNTAIDLTLEVITESQMDPISRTVIGEFGEWVDIVLPSAKALGLPDLQTLNNAWVKAEMVDTGRTYQNSVGETKHATTFKFTAVYPNEQACRAAYTARRNGGAAPAPAAPSEAQPPPAGNGENKERETALKFAKVYVQNAWRNSGKDLAKAQELLGPMLAQQPLISKHFTVDSPEILELLTEVSVPF